MSKANQMVNEANAVDTNKDKMKGSETTFLSIAPLAIPIAASNHRLKIQQFTLTFSLLLSVRRGLCFIPATAQV
jgi:hypothetical protein